MPIAPSDIVFRLSGGINNTSQNASLGDAKSSAVASASLFDDVNPAESAAGATEYRCVYVHNAHATLTLTGAKLFIATNTPNTATAMSVGVGSSPVGGTEQLAVNELAAPAGVSFSAPATAVAGIALGDIPPGSHRAIWVRRIVSPNAQASADGATFSVTGGTLS